MYVNYNNIGCVTENKELSKLQRRGSKDYSVRENGEGGDSTSATFNSTFGNLKHTIASTDMHSHQHAFYPRFLYQTLHEHTKYADVPPACADTPLSHLILTPS